MFTFLLVSFTLSVDVLPQQKWEPGERIKEALDTLTGSLKRTVENDVTGNASKYGISNLVGAYLKMGEKAVYTASLETGNSYVFAAGGDVNTADVDILIKDETGSILEKDDNINKFAVVLFTPSKTGLYFIELLTPTVKERGFAVVAMLEKTIYSNSANMYSAYENMVKSWLAYNSNKQYSTRFARNYQDASSNSVSFCFWGYFMDDNTSHSWSNSAIMPTKEFAFVTACDNDVKYLEVEINLTEEKNIRSDIEDDRTFIKRLSPKSATSFDFKYENLKTRSGKSFIMSTLIEITN